MGIWGVGPLENDEALDQYEKITSAADIREALTSGSIAEERAAVAALVENARGDKPYAIDRELWSLALAALTRASSPAAARTWGDQAKAYLAAVREELRLLKELIPSGPEDEPALPVLRKEIDYSWQGPPWFEIPVQDLAASAQFYETVLGAVLLQHSSDSFVLLLSEQFNQARVRSDFEPARLRRTLSAEGISALRERLEKRRDDFALSANGKVLTLHDPSGHEWVLRAVN